MRRRRDLGDLPNVSTGASWTSAFGLLFTAAQRARGATVVPDGHPDAGTIVPRITNREAAAIVQSMRALADMTQARWPLWYQSAAQAYGDGQSFDLSQSRGDALYDAEDAHELWKQAHRIMLALDDERADVPASIDLDPTMFDDRTFQNEMINAMKSDGAVSDGIFDDFLDQVRRTPDNVRDAIDRVVVKPIRENIIGGVVAKIAVVAIVLLAIKSSKRTRRRRRR